MPAGGRRVGDGFLTFIIPIIAIIGFIAIVIIQITQPRSGIVERVWLEPAHSEQYQSGSICAAYDNKGGCTMTIPIFSTRWVEDRCWVELNDVEKSHRKATWGIRCEQLPEIIPGKWFEVLEVPIFI